MYYVAYNDKLGLEGFYVESQKDTIPVKYVAVSDTVYEEVFNLGLSGNLYLKSEPAADTLLEDSTLFETREDKIPPPPADKDTLAMAAAIADLYEKVAALGGV